MRSAILAALALALAFWLATADGPDVARAWEQPELGLAELGPAELRLVAPDDAIRDEARADTAAAGEAGEVDEDNPATAAITAQIAAARSTEALLVTKREVRAGELRARVRTAYKLLRTGHAPLWVDRAARMELVRRRAAVRRVLARDRHELGLLADELASVARATRELERERARAASLVAPAPGSLRAPVHLGRVVAPFGGYRHGASGASLVRRGVVLSSRRGRNVRAVADGVVRWIGTIRGFGEDPGSEPAGEDAASEGASEDRAAAATVAVVAHEGFLSVSGPLDPVAVSRGQAVTRGDRLGESAGDRVGLEIRLDTGGPGVPIDPAPLLSE